MAPIDDPPDAPTVKPWEGPMGVVAPVSRIGEEFGVGRIMFEVQVHRQAGAALGFDAASISSPIICGLLVAKIAAGGLIDQYNQQNIEPMKVKQSDFVIGVNNVSSLESGVDALKQELRRAVDTLTLKVWGVRPLPEEEVRRMRQAREGAGERVRPQMDPILEERLRQLEASSHICTRAQWEELHVPRLPPDAAAGSRACARCVVCMTDIAPNERIRGLACGHYFHVGCVGRSFLEDTSGEMRCPLCRVPIHEQRALPVIDHSEFVRSL